MSNNRKYNIEERLEQVRQAEYYKDTLLWIGLIGSTGQDKFPKAIVRVILKNGLFVDYPPEEESGAGIMIAINQAEQFLVRSTPIKQPETPARINVSKVNAKNHSFGGMHCTFNIDRVVSPQKLWEVQRAIEAVVNGDDAVAREYSATFNDTAGWVGKKAKITFVAGIVSKITIDDVDYVPQSKQGGGL